MTSVGFIGLGTMGSRMARSMMRAGLELVVFDVNHETLLGFEKEGARPAAGPGAVAAQVDFLHLSLPDSPDVIAVAKGPGGIVEGAHDGLIVVDHSSIAPLVSRQLAQDMAAHGIDWLDAPVSGGPAGAAAGTLTLMIGGRAEALERCRPVLESIGKNIEHMGGSGTGGTTKVVNQLAVGIQAMAVFEAFTLGVTAGIPAERLFEVLRTSSSGSWVMEKLVPAVLLSNREREAPAAWFALRLQHKDMRLAVETASGLNVPLAAGALSGQLYAIAEGLGWGNQDQVSAINLYADYVGIESW
jgi:3-hydroxyisobutyrate dehydrogenase-like beta-hydroxyacid dehydrogenase